MSLKLVTRAVGVIELCDTGIVEEIQGMARTQFSRTR